MVECSVQQLLDELKQSNPLNVTSHIVRFDNYSLQLISMDDFMKLLVPKGLIMWEISVSKLKLKRLTIPKKYFLFVKIYIFYLKF